MTTEMPPYPPTFWSLVEQRAATDGDRPMLTDERGRQLTFGAYRLEAERAAAGLAALGVGSGTTVSWQLPTTLEAFVLMAALARLDAVQNPIIPILRHRDVGFIAGQTETDLLIVPGTWRGFDYLEMGEEIMATRSSGTRGRVLTADVTGSQGIGLPVGDPTLLPPPPPELAPDDLPVRWLYYSSGTTADPKGTRHTDWTVLHGATALITSLGLGPDDCYPVAYPVSHIGGVAVVVLQLMTACRLACVETFDARRSPAFMADVGATVLGSALPFIHAYLDAQRAFGDEPMFPRLRACLSGGAPKPVELHREVKKVLGGTGVLSSWGLTEFPIATHARTDDPDKVLATTEGHPVPGVQLRVVSLDGDEVPSGEEGELRLKGPQMFRGYLDSSLDAAAFDEDGWFRTGDLGVVEPSGAVRITGRLKDVIIRNAENISAQEVEDVLYGHPDIVDVAVIGLPDPRMGECCCAVVVLADGADDLTVAQAAEHCATQGLTRQKRPDRIELVDELPRNLMGKVLKADLRARYAEPTANA